MRNELIPQLLIDHIKEFMNKPEFIIFVIGDCLYELRENQENTTPKKYNLYINKRREMHYIVEEFKDVLEIIEKNLMVV